MSAVVSATPNGLCPTPIPNKGPETEYRKSVDFINRIQKLADWGKYDSTDQEVTKAILDLKSKLMHRLGKGAENRHVIHNLIEY